MNFASIIVETVITLMVAAGFFALLLLGPLWFIQAMGWSHV